MLAVACGMFLFIVVRVCGGSYVIFPGNTVGTAGVGFWAWVYGVVCDIRFGCVVMTVAGGVGCWGFLAGL